MIDFPAVIERAYEDGVRVFVEAGPGSSCTRLIGQILGRRAHLACSACRADSDALTDILDVLGRLIAERVRVDLAALYGKRSRQRVSDREAPRSKTSSRSTVRVHVRGSGFRVPPIPLRAVPAVVLAEAAMPEPNVVLQGERERRLPVARSMLAAESATAVAHRAFLRVSSDSAALIAKHDCIRARADRRVRAAGAEPAQRERSLSAGNSGDLSGRTFQKAVALDRRACREFAVGSAAAALGSDYCGRRWISNAGSAAR